MTLPAPRLDDRHFQDIVDEAKKRIPHYCKEWTDHNVSDPGVTMIELFAWMTDMILYRLNQVPDRHYIKFMEMLGIELREPVPAQVPVTFWLSAPQEVPILIPAGTEVSTTQTETEPAIIFTTDVSFQVNPPKLSTIITRIATRQADQKQYRTHSLRRLTSGFEGLEIFSQVPQVDDAIYFGFGEDISHHILGFQFDFDEAGGAGVDPALPPYLWEASSAQEGLRWEPAVQVKDTTKALNTAGQMQIMLPKMNRFSVNNESLYWVRLRIKNISRAEEEEGMIPYHVSPRLRQVNAGSWGGTVNATHAEQINDEILGRSEGSAGERYYLQKTPLLPRLPGENLIVQVEGAPPQVWDEVADFANSGYDDPHYTIDSITGELRLGPAIRQRDGTMKLYGRIPERGSNLIMTRYRYGGGQAGNVQAHALNTLKTGIPFIGRVDNRVAATGGMDAESLDSAMMRAPKLLRARDRAVTESDFEFLAREAMPAAIGRVKCLQPRPSDEGRVIPGQIYVLIIPRVLRPSDYLDPNELELKQEDIEVLTHYLDERRLLTTRFSVRAPAYTWVSVRAMLRPSPGADRDAVQNEVLRRLYAYLNPLSGGPNGEGWPFGRDLFSSDVYQALSGLPNIQFLRSVELYNAQPGRQRTGDPVEQLDVVAHGVIASGIHEVVFV